MKNRQVQFTKIAIMAIFGILFVAAFYFTLIGQAGITMATTPGLISGEAVDTENARSASSELLRPDIEKEILKIRPSLTPLDTIMREAKASQMKSFETQYYKVGYKPIQDTVKTTRTKASDASAATACIDVIDVNNPGMWSKDDTIIVMSVSGAATSDGGFLMLAITDIVNNQPKVFAINGATAGTGGNAGYTVIPTLTANNILIRAGKAQSEKDMQTSPFGLVPLKESNYAQLFFAQVEESTYEAMHNKEVEIGFTDYDEQNIYDMKMTMENSFLHGKKARMYDPVDKEEKYFTQGIIRDIAAANTYTYGANRTDYTATMTRAKYVDITKKLFTGNCGSEKRVMFAGNNFLAKLSNMDESIQKQLDAGQTEVQFGITFKKLTTNFGELLILHHQLFNMWGEAWTNSALCLDVNNLQKRVFKTLGSQELDMKTSGQRNVQAKVITETSCLIAKYLETHMLIQC